MRDQENNRLSISLNSQDYNAFRWTVNIISHDVQKKRAREIDSNVREKWLSNISEQQWVYIVTRGSGTSDAFWNAMAIKDLSHGNA
ncbi:hypothetical protein VB005_09292 [Metarhizium brunneum]